MGDFDEKYIATIYGFKGFLFYYLLYTYNMFSVNKQYVFKFFIFLPFIFFLKEKTKF
jgi:hypothetical protein